jgi:NIMA (never in mitosis gene a)-related kinase
VFLVQEAAPATPDAPPALWVVKKIAIFGMTPVEAARAKSEAALQQHLRHPCIVGYKDSFIQDDHLHIVMEYCNGGDLGSAIKRARAERVHFSEEQILDWFSQLCFAVAYIHTQHVLHRDLKTQNVFLMDNNMVRLGDFGIAKVLDHTFESAKSVVGTPYYMSPEVCQSKPYNSYSDVWALGCVLYELCTLCHAFQADNMLHLVVKIVQVRTV